MKANKAIWVVLLLVAVAAAGAVTWYVLRDEQPAQEQPEQDEVETGVTTSDGFSTDAVIFMEDEMPEADPMIVGKWQSSDNPQWYKVYYDDYDEDEQLFWGKEWDESEDVLEEDLKYHGNGWFRWEKKGKELCEYSTMDYRDVPIAKIYEITYLDSTTIAYHEKSRRQPYRFTRK